MKYHHKINSEISLTYIASQKKLTLVAAMGVTIGIAIFVFMNSMNAGFDRSSTESIFKSVPHIRLYKEDEISQPIRSPQTNEADLVVINPTVVPQNNVLLNPKQLTELLRNQKEVVSVAPQVMANVFFNNGKSQITGHVVGCNMEETNGMFNIRSYVVEGSEEDLKHIQNGILLGVGIARKMNLRTGDNISITSSRGVNKIMKIIGLFRTNNSNVDKTKAYVNISQGQQLLMQNSTYITDINIKVNDHRKAELYAAKLSGLTGYKAEDWKSANETIVATNRMRTIIITLVSFSILLVAGFGIYNILNMTISQKINDIAILKAMGFKGQHVVRIFVQQSLLIGVMGIVIGLLVAALLVKILSGVYVGGDIGYFPVRYEPTMFLRGIIFGLVVTFLAGYIPARKAANVDPVSIFRK